MRNLLFWQRWPPPEQSLFNLGVLVFLLALAATGYYYLITPEPVIGFQTITETQLTELPFQTFRTGIFELTIPANHYTVTERLLGTPMEPNLLASYLWLACFGIAITGLLAVVTTASMYYYLAAMGVFILLVVSLKMETLLVFGRDDKTFSIFVMAAYGLCSFYIYYFLPGLKFVRRFLCFAAITVVVAGIILIFSKAEYPALHLATYGYPAGILACVVFIVTVAHEIIASFIAILTRSGRRGKTLNHFLIITLIYMANLVLAYCVKFRFVNWNIITVNLFFLLAVSAILGLWGLRQRQKQLDGIIDVEPYALTGYLFLGALAFGALAWFLGTANDPAYDAVADVIIFSHLGYGFIFLLYILSNFGGPLSKNMAVHKVLYSPTTMPFFTFRFAGLIATIALAIYNTWQVPAHNALAGYQNIVADLYLTQENTRVAAVFYDQGRTYGYSNHHSNYALANLAGLKFDHDGEKGFYRAASYLRPTEMSYLNWAQMFQSEDSPKGAIEILEQGLRRFPRSAALNNTLGLLYAAEGNVDSAALILQGRDDELIRSNRLALAARKQLQVVMDTSKTRSMSAAMLANTIAYASSLGVRSTLPLAMPRDTSISVAQAAYLSNYLANHVGNVDSVALGNIEAFARKDDNAGLREPMLFSCALSRYSNGEIQKAFTLMEEVAIISENKGKYNNILALWCLDQGDPQRAMGFAEYALTQHYSSAYFTHAVALTEAARNGISDLHSAVGAWDSLSRSTDSSLVHLSRRTINILQTDLSSVRTLDAAGRYAFVRYRIPSYDTSLSLSLLAGIDDANLRARALLDLSKDRLAHDDLRSSSAILVKAMAVAVTDPSIRNEMALHQRILFAESDVSALIAAIKSPLTYSGINVRYPQYFDAIIAEAAGDTLRASSAFDRITRTSYFFDEGVLAAARYFQSHGTDALRSYKLLADAIQHHPSSIRLRKAYIREAKRVGFDDYVDGAMEDLKRMLPESDFRQFSAEVGLGG
jgi:hypothetical protein